VLTSLARRCRPHGLGKRAALTPDAVAIVTVGIGKSLVVGYVEWACLFQT
jgi:hypothetical protein